MPEYVPNVTDDQQAKREAAADDSAVRFASFDGKEEQKGEMKAVKALETTPATFPRLRSNGVPLVAAKTVGGFIGSHNDKYGSDAIPGKA